MKTRVKYYNGWYYPQVRRYFIWRHIMKADNYAFFAELDDAIEFINLGNWLYNNKVMWNSK